MTRTLASSIAECATEAGDAMLDASVTIANRLPILAGWFVAPSADGLAEWHDAASEKVAAAWDSAAAAFGCVQDAAWRSFFAPLTPAGMAHEAVVLVRAVNRPAMLRMRANAERFRQS